MNSSQIPQPSPHDGGTRPKGFAPGDRHAVTLGSTALDQVSSESHDQPADLVGTGPAFKRLLAEIAAYAPYSADVRLRGETGTGKTEIARALHAMSPRRAKPFVRVNCASEPAELFERHFFGSERGSFTGSVQQHKGYFEQADGGTLFLDEIAELTPSQQAKLLTALDSRTFLRVGGTRPLSVDVRVVSATNQDLESMVVRKLFREDLLARLGSLELAVPPLRERPEDVRLLFGYFLESWCAQNGQGVRCLAVEAGVEEALSSYSWPRNVRQLKNLTEALAIGAVKSGTITLAGARSVLMMEASRVRGGDDGRGGGAYSAPPSTESVPPEEKTQFVSSGQDQVIMLPPYRVGTPFDIFVAQIFLAVHAELVQRQNKERVAGLLHIPLRTLYLRLKAAHKLITDN